MAIMSLYDYTGLMVQPWLNRGERAVIVDTQHEGEQYEMDGRLLKLNWNIADSVEELIYLGRGMGCKLVMGFPPCTDVAVSGSKHFAAKEITNAYFRDESLHLAKCVQQIGEGIGCEWVAENPISTLSTLWRKPDFTFHPADFGGYLPEDDLHPMYPDYIAPRDAYTKLTCLWTVSGFTLPEKRPVAIPKSEKWSKQQRALGGSSLKTKNIRSATPRGFALAMAIKYLGE